MDSFADWIGANIKRHRRERKLSQKHLSEISGVAQNTINQYERSIRQPRIEQLQKIAKALNISINRLLFNAEDSSLLESECDESIKLNLTGVDLSTLKLVLNVQTEFTEGYIELLKKSKLELSQAYLRLCDAITTASQECFPDIKLNVIGWSMEWTQIPGKK